MDPKGLRFGARSVKKTAPKINAKIDAKMSKKGSQNEEVGGRGVARCGGGEGEVNPPLSSEEDSFEWGSHTPNPVSKETVRRIYDACGDNRPRMRALIRSLFS